MLLLPTLQKCSAKFQGQVVFFAKLNLEVNLLSLLIGQENLQSKLGAN